MAVLRSTLDIDAPADVVWDVLTDFGRWAEWNPSVPSITGDAELAGTVSLTLAMPGRPSAKVRATLTAVEPQRRLRWHGNAGADWLFAGDRDFVIEPADGGGVRFTHVEAVGGAMSPLFRLVMGGAIQRHHDGLSGALKQRAESLARQG